jgi:hypothetical protein
MLPFCVLICHGLDSIGGDITMTTYHFGGCVVVDMEGEVFEMP